VLTLPTRGRVPRNRLSLPDGGRRSSSSRTSTVAAPDIGFTRAIVCYKIDSESGHLFTPIHTSDGHFALFNDVLGDWAWKDFENGRQKIQEEGFGDPEASNRGTWIIHELRVEDGTLGYYVNQSLLGSVPLEDTEVLYRFALAANAGGRGEVDYVVIAGGPEGVCR
jgi:hypothetical protein